MRVVILPLFIITGLIIIIVLSKLKRKVFLVISWRKNAVIACIYLISLLVFIPVLRYLPSQDFIRTIPLNEKNSAYFRNGHIATKEISSQRNFENQPEVFINSSKTFNLSSNKLKFDIAPNINYDDIYIKHKNIDDGKIEVNTYVDTYITTHLARGIDFTKVVLPPNITLASETLSISHNQQSLDFKWFDNDFPLKQFKYSTKNNMSTHFGRRMIEIIVPKGLEIEKGKIEIKSN